MSQLHQKTCIPCQGGMPSLLSQEAELLLKDIEHWQLIEDDTKLYQKFEFPNFIDAQNFAVRVGQLAETENHHPDICYGWGYCAVTFFTHKIGGLHENDFIMAAKVDRLALK